jgi:hypothetical protein
LGYDIKVKPESSQTIRFFIAGSYTSKMDAEETFEKLTLNAETYLKDKQKHYAIIASKAKITVPDKELEKAFEWIKYNTEWLVREVPEVGRGLGAGMPDYPWWFGWTMNMP